jgi:hypothetical protein
MSNTTVLRANKLNFIHNDTQCVYPILGFCQFVRQGP